MPDKKLRTRVAEQLARLNNFKMTDIKALARILGLRLSHAIKGNPHARLKKGELIAAIKKEIGRNYNYFATGNNSRMERFATYAERIFLPEKEKL